VKILPIDLVKKIGFFAFGSRFQSDANLVTKIEKICHKDLSVIKSHGLHTLDNNPSPNYQQTTTLQAPFFSSSSSNSSSSTNTSSNTSSGGPTPGIG
jgi:hypothetical protein